jgi:hypothetical protein
MKKDVQYFGDVAVGSTAILWGGVVFSVLFEIDATYDALAFIWLMSPALLQMLVLKPAATEAGGVRNTHRCRNTLGHMGVQTTNDRTSSGDLAAHPVPAAAVLSRAQHDEEVIRWLWPMHHLRFADDSHITDFLDIDASRMPSERSILFNKFAGR